MMTGMNQKVKDKEDKRAAALRDNLRRRKGGFATPKPEKSKDQNKDKNKDECTDQDQG